MRARGQPSVASIPPTSSSSFWQCQMHIVSLFVRSGRGYLSTTEVPVDCPTHCCRDTQTAAMLDRVFIGIPSRFLLNLLVEVEMDVARASDQRLNGHTPVTIKSRDRVQPDEHNYS
eukprot:6719451-Pyramimonas_sp.AAC.1